MSKHVATRSRATRYLTVAAGALLLLGLGTSAWAVVPVVKTVPWVASNPLIPHDTWSGKAIRLKGTSDVQGANFEYSWDFGDGTSTPYANVTNQYALEASKAYTGAVGTIFTARLTVRDKTTGETGSALYYVKIEPQTLATEVNVAIDEGLWFLHKSQQRFVSGPTACGYWHSGDVASSSYYANDATNVTAFFVNGHLETGAATNPYTETVQRAMCHLPQVLQTVAISTITFPAPVGGPHNADLNGNGIALRAYQSSIGYDLGPILDAFVASGNPTKVATTGPANVIGRTYKDLVQDMAEWYMAAMTYCGSYWGGWDYNGFSCRNDFSVAQWGAIGLIAAERQFGINVPQWVKDANAHGVATMQAASGGFGYDSPGYFPWGPYAVTPSGMVQAVMDGIGRGNPIWDKAETFMRDNFCNAESDWSTSVKRYYYGLFSFTKSMLLHDSNGDEIAEPITLLQSKTAGVTPIDWYAAETAKGDPCNGVARRLVGDQNASGYWYGNDYYGTQWYFDTAWAIIMLNRTVFESGQPVAVAQAIPNPAVAGQTVQLDGAGSFHQDAGFIIDSWQWDLDNDGQYDDADGPLAMVSFPALGTYPVGLRVTDNAAAEKSATTTINVIVSIPPLAPTAAAGGPYNFCPQAQPWFLNGTGSVNPDEGQSEPGQPGDTIQAYVWELDGDGQFDDATGPQPNVTSFFVAAGVGDHLIQLRVTDTTSTSFPSSGSADLSDTDFTQVTVREASDPVCAACVSDLAARAKDRKIQLVWSDSGAPKYNVYRGTISGGPYLYLGTTTSSYSTYLDSSVVNGTKYYYVVRPALANNTETCQSNEASATPSARTR